MKIRAKLTLALLLAGLVPLIALGYFCNLQAEHAVTEEVFNKLESVSVVQKH